VPTLPYRMRIGARGPRTVPFEFVQRSRLQPVLTTGCIGRPPDCASERSGLEVGPAWPLSLLPKRACYPRREARRGWLDGSRSQIPEPAPVRDSSPQGGALMSSARRSPTAAVPITLRKPVRRLHDAARWL